MRPMTRVRRALVLIPLLLTQIGCDQATKSLARRELMGEGPMSFLGGLFKLAYTENPGAFLGLGGRLGAELRFWLLIVGVGAALMVGLAILLARQRVSIGSALAGALVLAGGFGNLIDRLGYQGRVVDFMQLGAGPLHTGVFNVADLQIVAGVALLIWLSRKSAAAVEEQGTE